MARLDRRRDSQVTPSATASPARTTGLPERSSSVSHSPPALRRRRRGRLEPAILREDVLEGRVPHGTRERRLGRLRRASSPMSRISTGSRNNPGPVGISGAGGRTVPRPGTKGQPGPVVARIGPAGPRRPMPVRPSRPAPAPWSTTRGPGSRCWWSSPDRPAGDRHGPWCPPSSWLRPRPRPDRGRRVRGRCRGGGRGAGDHGGLRGAGRRPGRRRRGDQVAGDRAAQAGHHVVAGFRGGDEVRSAGDVVEV